VQGVEVRVLDDDSRVIVDVNPATGETIAEVKVTFGVEVERLVEKGKAAQRGWAKTPLRDRVDALKAAVKALAPRADELCALMQREMGKLATECEEEVAGAVDKDAYLELIFEANQDVQYENAKVVREPHGLVGISAPWNFPVDEILLNALPALAAGNAALVKPSEVAPLCGAAVVEVLAANLPEDVVGLVQRLERGLELRAAFQIGYVVQVRHREPEQAREISD